MRAEVGALQHQHDRLSEQVGNLKSEHTALVEELTRNKELCMEAEDRVRNAEGRCEEYVAAANQTKQQLSSLHGNMQAAERQLTQKREEIAELKKREDHVSVMLQDRQDKLQTAERKLLNYTQRLNTSKATVARKTVSRDSRVRTLGAFEAISSAESESQYFV
eukprot:sb/3472661/